MRIKNVLIVIWVLTALSLAQAQEASLERIRERFDNFEYSSVITLADSMLLRSGSLTKDESSELLLMKAVSQYSLSDTASAAESFTKILEIHPSFILDPLNTSPKIIAFFDAVKSRYKPPKKEDPVKQEEQIQPQNRDMSSATIYLSEYNSRLKNSLVRSLVLPGWGHFYSGNSAKGWILSSAAAASLASLIYFISDSRTKEKSYLNERDPNLIPSKYDKYNTSNKMKYLSLGAYALVWIYSQADILFLSDGLFRTVINADPQADQISMQVSVPLR